MRDLSSLALKVVDGCIQLLDQRLLPNKEEWLEIENPEEMADAIKKLKVRGAPLIGVAAAVSLANFAEKGASQDEFETAAEMLRESRPTAVNLMYAINLLLSYESSYNPSEVIVKAEKLFEEDKQLCQRIAENGSSLIPDKAKVLTHCNTGGLATLGEGTALGVIKHCWSQGKKIEVYVDETRPLLQGGRLTTWELEKSGIPYKLICDNMAAMLMAKGEVSCVIVGADRVATNGDFANKVGTYGLAVLCHYHKIPFYMAAPFTTIDRDCDSGANVPIEVRAEREVKGYSGFDVDVQWGPEKGEAYNPAFDVTPANLVSAWIFDNQVYNYSDIKRGALK